MTSHNALTAYIEGISLIGPGFASWPQACAILAGAQPYVAAKTVLPAPSLLPPAERRRAGALIRLTLATGLEAIAHAGLEAAALPTVFASSGGDGDNCHVLCETLASDDPQISPTRFHNSVHNTASGYWSIATGATAPSSVLAAHDAGFGAGLLEALTQAVVDQTRVVLIACDTAYPEPLRRVRPIPDAFGIALVIAPERSERALSQITVTLTDAQADTLDEITLETLRRAIPAARGLPLLQAIARRQSQHVVLDYLADTRLGVDVLPC